MITNDMESRKKTDNIMKLKGGVVMGKLFFVFTLCLVFTTYAGAYDVVNIDLNGSTSDPCYYGKGPVQENYGGVIDVNQWNGYLNVEGDLMESPRCENIGVHNTPGTYARSVFIADDPCNAHGYQAHPGGVGDLLGDGFYKLGTPNDPNPGIYLYGNWAHGGIFDVYLLANAPGQFTLRDGRGTIQSDILTGAGDESSWNENLNYVKFEDVWIGGTATRDANGPEPNYLDYNEYLIDPNCAVISYSNKICGIQLASVKKKVQMISDPNDPCIVYWDNTAATKRKKILQGEWTTDTPIKVLNTPLPSGRRLFFASDYDAAYETNYRGSEHDFDGPDAGWCLQPDGNDPLRGYVDERWARNGYLNYVDTGEWCEYDIEVTSADKGQYKVRALLNCWWAAADMGIYVDDSLELGTLTHPQYSGMSPPVTDPNVVVWSEDYVYFNFFTGFRKFRWRQNGSYYNVLGFELAYVQPIQVPDCDAVFKYNLQIPGDITEDCYVNMEDLKVIVEDWANCNNPEDPNCVVEEPSS